MSYLNKIKKLNTQKKIGILFILSLVFINQYVWLEFFDSDGYLKPIAKSRILFVDFLLLFIGFFLYFSNFDYKLFFKKSLYVIYLFIAIEILSYIALRVLFPFYFEQKNTELVSRYCAPTYISTFNHFSFVGFSLLTSSEERWGKFSTNFCLTLKPPM